MIHFYPNLVAKLAKICPKIVESHIWSNLGQITPNYLNILKTQILSALLTASSLQNLLTKTICPYMGIRTKFGRFQTINWSDFALPILEFGRQIFLRQNQK